MKKLSLKEEIMFHLMDKWGEHIESSDNPCQTTLDILLNTIITLNEEVQFLRKIKASL